MNVWSLYIELFLSPSTFFHNWIHSGLNIPSFAKLNIMVTDLYKKIENIECRIYKVIDQIDFI